MRYVVAAFFSIAICHSQSIVVETKMSPPVWALLERELLKANSQACDRFASRYLDSRGYLLHTPRWGTLDGPDDAIETFHNWTLLHALGASDSVLHSFKKALDGHYLQYKELRTVKTQLSKDGAYHNEFITQSDWFHTGEGMRGIMFQALSDPYDEKLIGRMQRFASLYMSEPNYDPKTRVIKSLWTGSKGPMLHKATVYDWVGDPVSGTFHLLHSPDGREKMYDLEKQYPKMLAHCAEYLDSVGDHPLNMGTTGLALNAFVLTGDEKYKRWIGEYAGAWKERTDKNGGNIPTNVGLNGVPGGEYGGRWYKGTYGWNFTIFDGELEQIAHRNTVFAGSWPGFANLYLTTGDAAVLATLRRQMDNLYAQKKDVNGKPALPQMFGDPRGYKHSGQEQWYHWTPNLHTDRLTEIYMLSMDRADLERIPKTGWIGYLEGAQAGFPEQALRRDLDHVRRRVEEIRTDPTSADTRLADYVMSLNPATTDALSKLTMGAFLTGNIWSLHARFRYFDPAQRRAGLPEDVAALVNKLTADAASVTLVNTSSVEPRTVVVQAGGYAEHEFVGVEVEGKQRSLGTRAVTVRLAPGAGATLNFQMKRYAHAPTATMPWDR